MTTLNGAPIPAPDITDEQLFENMAQRLFQPEAFRLVARTRGRIAHLLQSMGKEVPMLEGVSELRALARDPDMTDEAFFEHFMIFFANKIDFNSK